MLPDKFFAYLCDKGKYIDLRKNEGVYACSTENQKRYFSVVITTDKDYLKNIVREFTLYPNYPNPFNPVTNIRFGIPYRWRDDGYKIDDPIKTRIVVYNIRGQRIRTLVDSKLEPGYHNVLWRGKDYKNNHVASGLYIYGIQAGEFKKAKRMVLLK